MSKNKGKQRSPSVSLDELLVECIDALRVPAWDSEDRAEHLRLLRAHTRRRNISMEVRSLLKHVSHELGARSPIDFVFDDRSRLRREALVAEVLESEDLNIPRFAYHGTICGRLASIAELGLRPAFKPVWKDPDLAARCAEFVFLADTWRGAAGWAQTAHLHSRGRRDGFHRRPVIIRISATGLDLEVDRVATAPGNLQVRGPVSVESAVVFVGPLLSGYPHWRPLAEAIAMR